MAKRYVMTPARRAALRKAQRASALKRKTRGVVRQQIKKRSNKKTTGGKIWAIAGTAVAGYMIYGQTRNLVNNVRILRTRSHTSTLVFSHAGQRKRVRG